MSLHRRLQPAIAGRHQCGKRVRFTVLWPLALALVLQGPLVSPPPEEVGNLTIMTLDLALFRIWYRGHHQMHNA